jgi:hypothetical protein
MRVEVLYADGWIFARGRLSLLAGYPLPEDDVPTTSLTYSTEQA